MIRAIEHSESDERDAFVHFSELCWFSREDMTEGAEVAVDIGEDPRSGRTEAMNVSAEPGPPASKALTGSLATSRNLEELLLLLGKGLCIISD